MSFTVKGFYFDKEFVKVKEEEWIIYTCGKYSPARLTHAHVVHCWFRAQLSPKGGSQHRSTRISQCVVISQRFGLVSSWRRIQTVGTGKAHMERISKNLLTLAGPELLTVSVIHSSRRSASACPCMPQTSALSIHICVLSYKEWLSPSVFVI